MTRNLFRLINTVSFVVCLASIFLGCCIGGLGTWGTIPYADGTLWRALGTCGILFAGSVLTSLAIRCFKANESGIMHANATDPI